MTLRRAKMYALTSSSTSTQIPSGTFISFFSGPARPPDPPRFSFHQDYPDPLVRLQDKHWNPLLAWARDTFNIEFYTFQSVLFSSQPDATKQVLDEELEKLDSWKLAGCVSFILISVM